MGLKIIGIVVGLLLMTAGVRAQPDSIPVNPDDVRSVDAIVASLYDVVSGPAGEKRNWPRMRTLFAPHAKMIPTGRKADSTGVKRVLSVEEYITSSGAFLEKNGFFEKEIVRKTEQYGNIVQVFSTYESRHKAGDEKPFMRGINSIQLWFDGKRWWIINIMWENESKDVPIPTKYLR
jgi:hypothetical protein